MIRSFCTKRNLTRFFFKFITNNSSRKIHVEIFVLCNISCISTSILICKPFHIFNYVFFAIVKLSEILFLHLCAFVYLQFCNFVHLYIFALHWCLMYILKQLSFLNSLIKQNESHQVYDRFQSLRRYPKLHFFKDLSFIYT